MTRKKEQITAQSKEQDLSSTMLIDIAPDPGGGDTESSSHSQSHRHSPPVIKIPRKTRAGEKARPSRYQQLFQSVYDGAVITDFDGRITDVNPRAIEFFRYSAAEMLSRNIIEFISGAETSLLDSLQENLQNERFILLQAHCIRKDASLFPVEIAINILKSDKSQMCLFIRDVTRRLEAEEMLKVEHNAIQNAGAGIAIADAKGTLEYVNPSTVALWEEESPANLVGTAFSNLWRDKDVAEEILRLVLGGHENWSGELSAQRLDGSHFSVQTSASCNRDADGELIGMVLSFVDISDRKRAEEALRRAEAHEAMLASLGATCHHLGQPATVLLTNLEIMKRKPEFIEQLLGSSLEAAELLREILHKLNMPDAVRLTPYLSSSKGGASASNKILEI